MIVRTDNMVVVSYINCQGGSRSHILNRFARCLLLWSQDKFLYPESGSRSGSFEPCRRFSIEAETQAGGMNAEPSDSSPDFEICSVKRKWTSLHHESLPNACFGST